MKLGLDLPAELMEEIARRSAEIVLEQLDAQRSSSSPYMTIPEAADFLRCRDRQRVDDLLTQGRLSRFKDGGRTLVSRAELEAYVAGNGSNGVAHPLPPSSQSRTGRAIER